MRTSLSASAAAVATSGAGNTGSVGQGDGMRTRSDVVASADADVLEVENTMDLPNADRTTETTVQRWRRKVYTFFSDPSSSRPAFFFSVYFNLLIVFSTIAFCLQTVPDLNDTYEDTMMWFHIEIFIITQFTFEYVVRLVTAPSRRAFVLSPLNIIDLVAILPFYLELILYAIWGSDTSVTAVAVIRVVRLVRVFRLFKLGQHSRQVRMVARAFARSRDGIFLLVFMLGLAVTFFSTCMYFAETASCTLIDNVWTYNPGTPWAGLPSQYQVTFASLPPPQ